MMGEGGTPGAPLILYGPWRVQGELLVYSNHAFDAKLKERMQLLAEQGTAWMSYWDRHVRGSDRRASRPYCTPTLSRGLAA